MQTGQPQAEIYRPPLGHPLYPCLHSIWCVRHTMPGVQETILPTQTADFLFNLDTPIQIIEGLQSGPLTVNGFFVAGVHTRSIVTSQDGAVHLVGVSLKVEGASPMLPLPSCELTDQTVEASLVLPRERHIYEQVAEATSFHEQCQVLIRWLMRLYRPTQHFELVQRACQALRQQPTSQMLDRIAGKLHLSSRHLRRLMIQHVGIGPAQYMRLSRFAQSLYLMPHAPSLTAIAYNVHYADQAHFCRDFRDIAGLTPKEYRLRMSSVPGHCFAADGNTVSLGANFVEATNSISPMWEIDGFPLASLSR